ncbi:MAG TPA: thiamine diphosphokinase [Acidimicrobiales bacterium]|nr:thiamine diphosphokinase [Acidimicrobiales bacterium]
MDAERTVLLFTGGDPVDPRLALRLPDEAFVIAADSGLAQAVALGRRVDLAVGDFDSVDLDALERAQRSGAVVERHPEAKDETDLELGLAAAAGRCADHVVVVGGHGGRVDHFLANALLLASPRFAAMRVEAYVGASTITVVRERAELRGAPGDLVSLLAVGGAASGVRTEGLVYPLRGERLDAGSTRGVSNVFIGADASVELDDGTLLAVQPGTGG